MAKTSKCGDEIPPDEAERRRDAILKRMLQTKPKQQKDLMAERKAKRRRKGTQHAHREK
jgi:hypothetical protein